MGYICQIDENLGVSAYHRLEVIQEYLAAVYFTREKRKEKKNNCCSASFCVALIPSILDLLSPHNSIFCLL